MIFIAHRGNIDGTNRGRENNPDYISEAISKGYDVEIDVWFQGGDLYLGHDTPQYKVSAHYLVAFVNKLWCHAKDAHALRELVNMGMNCFFHTREDVVLTSKQYLWTFPGKELVKGSIAVLPEIHDDDISVCAGVCSDFVKNYQERMKHERC